MRILGSYVDAIQGIIALNIFMFMFTLVLPNFTFTFFGLTPALILTTPWTLITSMFVHYGFTHLLFNMLALFFMGSYLEQIVGEHDFLKVYFLGGLIGSVAYVLTSLLFHIPPPYVVGVGASGAIASVIGALVVLRPRQIVYINFLFPMPLYVLGMLYIIISIQGMLFPFGNIAHNAHLGGLLAGMWLGSKLKRKIPHYYGYGFGGFGIRY